jgi:hypothetical protein
MLKILTQCYALARSNNGSPCDESSNISLRGKGLNEGSYNNKGTPDGHAEPSTKIIGLVKCKSDSGTRIGEMAYNWTTEEETCDNCSNSVCSIDRANHIRILKRLHISYALIDCK